MAGKFVRAVMALGLAAMVGGCEARDGSLRGIPSVDSSDGGRATGAQTPATPTPPPDASDPGGSNDPVSPPDAGTNQPTPPPQNRAPQIVSFSCSPSSGTVPLEVTCTWSVRDPDGDPLTCAFDGQSPQPCSSNRSASLQLTAPGQRQLSLRADDGRGGIAQRSFVIEADSPPPPPPPPATSTVDVSIARVDWGQSVISETPRLVAGKSALLRVHVLSNVANTSGIAVRATGTRNGTTLGTLNLAGPGTLPTAIQEGTLSQSFTATVPASWIEPGLELQIEADADGAIAEADEQNNLRVITPTVGAGTVLYVTAVPVVHQGTTASVPSSYASQLVRFWPLQAVQGSVRAPYTFSGTLSGSNSSAWSTLLQQIAAVRASDGSSRYYYGFVNVSYGSGIAGIGYVGAPSATGRDDSLSTMVHELGHNFGRDHAPCGTSGDPNFPYAGGRIGSWGYDAQTNALVSPSTDYDLMSYCNPSWISDYNYRAAQSSLEANPPAALSVAGTGISAAQSLLLVSGRVAPDGTVTLSPLVRFHGPLEHTVDGDWTLRLQTASGAMAETRFGTEKVADVDESHFTLVVPDPGPLRSVEIARAGQPVLVREARNTPKPVFEPRVTEAKGRVVLEWDSVNWPYASVAHLGNERTTLGLWLTGGRAELPVEGLPCGGSLEVTLSDGVNSVTSTVER